MLKADAQDLKTIFEKQRRHKIPLYQRRYVWNQEDQWEPLWQDVENLAQMILEGQAPRAHFLGAVVLKQDETPSREIETRLVIDGQQRLTTLQLLLAAARDVYKALGAEYARQVNTVEFLTVNQAGVDDPEDEFKIWPTQADRDEYLAVLTAGSPQEVQKRVPNGDARLRDAYLFYYDMVDEWVSRDGASGRVSRVEALQGALVRGLMVVIIDLSLEDDAQVIFESLNARGTPLLQSELVKNYLLHLSEVEGGPTQRLHDQYWVPFESEEFWTKEVKQGRLYRPRVEIFLQHFLAMELTREVSALKLFDEFKRYVDATPQKGPEDYLASLRRYGDIFHSFQSAQSGQLRQDFFYRIDVMQVSTLYPFLLSMYDRLDDVEGDQNLDQILSDLESFLVRRMVCRLTTKQYNKLFLDLLRHSKTENGVLGGAVRQDLLSRTADSELWPDDGMFLGSWLSEPIYRRITRGRLRIIFEAIEMSLRTPKTEEEQVQKRLTVEHIMPRAWRANWSLPDESVEAEERRESLIHTIGNLTLLTKSLNPSLRNSAWPTKKAEIGKHSILRLNKYFSDIANWDEEHILARGQALFEHATAIWPYPSAD